MSIDYAAERQEYFNQTVSWRKYTGTNDEAQPDYATAVNIAARKVGKHRRTVNAGGEIITTTTYVGTNTFVSVGDKIDGEIVKDVLDAVGEDGVKVGVDCYI